MELWTPPRPELRPNGMECLIWHRGRWRHVRWVAELPGWMMGYASAYIPDLPETRYAPLPESTPPHEFWEGERS